MRRHSVGADHARSAGHGHNGDSRTRLGDDRAAGFRDYQRVSERGQRGHFHRAYLGEDRAGRLGGADNPPGVTGCGLTPGGGARRLEYEQPFAVVA